MIHIEEHLHPISSHLISSLNAATYARRPGSSLRTVLFTSLLNSAQCLSEWRPLYPLAVVRLPGPVFSQPKAVPDPIGLAFVVGVVVCEPLLPPNSDGSACRELSAVLAGPLSWPSVVVVVEDTDRFALAMVLLGRKTLIGRELLGLAYVEDDLEAASLATPLEDVARQEEAHTPDSDFESGVAMDFSLPVVDLSPRLRLLRYSNQD